MQKEIVEGEVVTEATTEISKKDQLIAELQAEEDIKIKACSQELAATLQKHGYELFIEQSIKIRKVQ